MFMYSQPHHCAKYRPLPNVGEQAARQTYTFTIRFRFLLAPAEEPIDAVRTHEGQVIGISLLVLRDHQIVGMDSKESVCVLG